MIASVVRTACSPFRIVASIYKPRSVKGEPAVRTTLAIIETYAQVRAMVRDMEALQTLKDGSVEQATKLSQAGHKLASLIGDNLSTDSTKTTIGRVGDGRF